MTPLLNDGMSGSYSMASIFFMMVLSFTDVFIIVQSQG